MFDVDHEQHTTRRSIANQSKAIFVVAAGVNQARAQIEEHFGGLVKGHTIVFDQILRSLRFVPIEDDTPDDFQDSRLHMFNAYTN